MTIKNKKVTNKIVITAGGTGGHIFPALSMALVLKKRYPETTLVWIGTARSREVELCKKNNIPIMILDVTGMQRKLNMASIMSVLHFLRAILSVMHQFRKDRPKAVIAFGGYVCAPVLAACVIKKVPFYLQEQNTIAGLVNKLFSRYAKKMFLGFPLAGKGTIAGNTEVTGIPVRLGVKSYEQFPYPDRIDRKKKTILVSGGSQGAQSMNIGITHAVKTWAASGLQVIWQTGTVSFDELSTLFSNDKNVIVFATLDDLYPYYALSKCVIGRAGASTLAEVSYFGLPCVLIPLPWAAENHQWVNAGLVEMQGWGIRVAQDALCSENAIKALSSIVLDEKKYNAMCMKALDHSPAEAADKIVSVLARDLHL